jgi:putative DNA primase/helicase
MEPTRGSPVRNLQMALEDIEDAGPNYGRERVTAEEDAADDESESPADSPTSDEPTGDPDRTPPSRKEPSVDSKRQASRI